MHVSTAHVGVLLLVAFSISCAQPSWSPPPSENEPRPHVMVRFTDSSLHPTVARVLEGGSVSWVNEASTFAATIVFSDAVAEAFTCDDLRPNWSKSGTGYQSVPITMGGATDDLELPCPLRPGTYDYEIGLFSGPMAGGAGFMDDPQLTMPGQIVVEPKGESDE